MTSGQIALQLGVSQTTLRNWEREGFVTPLRTSGNWRVFSEKDLRTMRKRMVKRQIQKEPAQGNR